MRWTVALIVLSISTARDLASQDMAVFGAYGRPGSEGNAPAYGGGFSVSGYTRLGNIVGKDLGALKESELRVGVRASLKELWATDNAWYRCIDDCAPDDFRVRTNLRLYQLQLLMLPFRTPSTRVEMGGGVTRYALRRDFDNDGWGFAGVVGASRRLTSRAWVSFAFEPHAWIRPPLADGPLAPLPRHMLRLGVSYSTGGRN